MSRRSRSFFLVAALVALLLAAIAVRACTHDRPLGEERDGPLVIERLYRVDLRPLDLAASVHRGETITIELGGQPRLLWLKPKNLVAPGCAVITLAQEPATTPCPTDL